MAWDKISEIEPLLDRIVLQNDHIALWTQRRTALLNDGNDPTDDLGISDRIKSCEKIQQQYADDITHIDNRGTARVRMLCDYMKTLMAPHVTEDIKRLAKNRMIIMGLLPIYRMRRPKQTQIITEMLGKLPTSGRDYSMFEWHF